MKGMPLWGRRSDLIRKARRARRAGDREGGFTLIELLIVVVILGVLAAIVVFAVDRMVGLAPQATCRNDYKAVEEAVQAFKVQEGSYPTTVDDLLKVQASPAGGPWLRDEPASAGHFQIAVAGDVVQVDPGPGKPPITTPGIDACNSVT
jgi:prepilin-type N-terminal cleavage/methylation domain-containing protein